MQKGKLFFRRRRVVVETKSKRVIVLPFKGVTIFLIAILVASTLFFALRSDVFLIHDLSVSLDQKVPWCVDENAVLTSTSLRSRSIFFANFDQEENNLKSKFLCVKTIAFVKDYPDGVNINVKVRQPLALIKKLAVATGSAKIESATNSADLITVGQAGSGPIDEASRSAQVEDEVKQMIVDLDGFAFSSAENFGGIPTIYSLQKLPKLGETISAKPLTLAANLTKELEKFELSISQIVVLDLGSVEVDFGEYKVLFSPEKDLAEQASSLQLILRQAKIDGDQVETVDLRFDKPVVKFYTDG